MAITTTNGTAYMDNGKTIDVSDREYFKESIEGKKYISSIVSSKVDGKRSNIFSIPIYENGDIVAVLWASILTDDFYKEINLDSMDNLGDTFIVDSEGHIVASDESTILNLESLNLLKDFNDKSLKITKNDFNYSSIGYIKLKSNDKNNYFLYYAKTNYNNWYLVNLIDNKSIKTYYNDIIQNLTIANVLSVLFISIALIIIFNKEKKDYKNLKLLAYTDTITKGKNDIFLMKNISNFINKKEKFAFISLEIINIKNMITTLGLKNTQFLLKEVYMYLYDTLNEEELVIHSYFGEYKLIMKYDNIEEFRKRLDSINFSKINENIKFIMGIYLIDKSDISYEEMCSYVSIAKESLNNKVININIDDNKYIIYNKEIHNREIEKIKLEQDIKDGIKNKEFKAWFQPKYGKEGELIGAEALIRWYKYGSIISPYVFVPICESNGLIKELDELVFENVCKNIRTWIDNNKKVVPISINLSRSYLDKVNFIDNLEEYIEKYKVPKNLIYFEITESSLIGNEKKLKNIVSLLHEKGFKVMLDDFGVGYSSIKTVSDVNFDVLKIDKSFVDGIGEAKWDSIIKYTINLANKLGMKVIAEGVETEKQYKFLLDLDCDMFQGYYFNKPMDSNDFLKLI